MSDNEQEPKTVKTDDASGRGSAEDFNISFPARMRPYKEAEIDAVVDVMRNAEGTLHSADSQKIDAAVKDAIEALGANGGLILSAAVELGTKEQSMLDMIDSWRNYRDMFS